MIDHKAKVFDSARLAVAIALANMDGFIYTEPTNHPFRKSNRKCSSRFEGHQPSPYRHHDKITKAKARREAQRKARKLAKQKGLRLF